MKIFLVLNFVLLFVGCSALSQVSNDTASGQSSLVYSEDLAASPLAGQDAFIGRRFFVFFYNYQIDEKYVYGQYGTWTTKGLPSFKMVEAKVAKSVEGLSVDAIGITSFKEVDGADFACLFRERLGMSCPRN